MEKSKAFHLTNILRILKLIKNYSNLVFKLDNFYLCNFLGVWCSSFKNLDFLINIWRVEPSCTISAFTEVTLLPNTVKIEEMIIMSYTIYPLSIVSILRHLPLFIHFFFLQQISQTWHCWWNFDVILRLGNLVLN